MYEPRHQKPIPKQHFVRRLITHAVGALAIVVFSLLLGMIGYRYYENLSLLDAFLNSAMLLGGMGPVEFPQTANGKLFAGLYALYAGLVFIVTAGLIVAPLIHRMLHLFHWDEKMKS